MTAIEMLIAARTRIANESAWCRGSSARNELGKSVDVHSADAASWDAMGSLYACIDENNIEASALSSMNAVGHLNDTMHKMHGKKYDYVSSYNDNPSTTHKDVIALYDRAIATIR